MRQGSDWERGEGGNLIFATEWGRPLQPIMAFWRWYRLLEAAGLPRMRIHDLRQGAASLMAAMGIPPRVAMQLHGHSSIATTMNIHAHVADKYRREAMDRVGETLWGAG